MFAAREAEIFLEGLKSPEAVSERTLLEKIVRPNQDCELGRAAGFASIETVDQYRARVPIRDYEAFRPFIDRMVKGEEGVLFTEPIRRFFLTSGSTAKPKYIPVNSSFIRDKSRAFGIYWSLVFAQHPEVSNDKIVTNFSDSGEMGKAPSGLPASSESAYWGQVTAATQRRARPIIPKAIARISDTEARYYAIARVLLEEEFQGLMTLNPSTIYLLFHKMNQFRDLLLQDLEEGTLSDRFPIGEDARAYVKESYAPNPSRRRALEDLLERDEPRLRAHAVWPHLKLVVSWRSPMLRPYLELLDRHLVGISGRDYISMASEGIISIPVKSGMSGGAVANSVHFYEFIPEELAESPDPKTKLSHELEVGRRYVVVLSTPAGLYRYNIGDVVRVVEMYQRTPVIEFLHRIGNTCSLTGEKLTEDQVTEAVAEVAKTLLLDVETFTAHPAESGFPRYVFLLELKTPAASDRLGRFSAEIDRALFARNIEYASKRESERLGAPELWLVKPGSYAARRARRVAEGANEAQLKPTHLSRDVQFWRQLEIAERIHG